MQWLHVKLSFLAGRDVFLIKLSKHGTRCIFYHLLVKPSAFNGVLNEVMEPPLKGRLGEAFDTCADFCMHPVAIGVVCLL